MALKLQNFPTLVQNMAAAVQGAASQLLDLTVGSPLRAILQAVAAVQLWLQYLVVIVLQQAFLTTASGAQVDAWLAQFPLFGGRLGATFATGNVTFARFTATSSALVPVGAQVRTADGTQTFAVVADSTVPLWLASSNGYLIPGGTASVTVPVQAVNAGAQANVSANTISQIVGAIPFIDTVNNANAFTNGIDAETDAAVKARFQVWQENLAQGTYGAVGEAVESVAADLTYTIAPNATADGAYTPGTFTVTIDDGSGATPSGTIAEVTTAVNAVRPIGSVAVVQAAAVVRANISVTLSVGSGYQAATAQAAVASAIAAYIGALPVGQAMPYSVIAKLAYDAYAGVTNVTSIFLNENVYDLTVTPSQVVRAGLISVNP